MILLRAATETSLVSLTSTCHACPSTFCRSQDGDRYRSKLGSSVATYENVRCGRYRDGFKCACLYCMKVDSRMKISEKIHRASNSTVQDSRRHGSPPSNSFSLCLSLPCMMTWVA
ncbi:hypothetical protein BDZ85DRAFT_260169 [Elsinoe ampelina]|uniref:Uncharacterized protein n=1 Tax=Elsinoe ampelina TaxID=302913 RepID=A0A6A6GEC5_9PEZI|nr:hypothetical protein BDZ85DRAFT_260169 [Elsinoe ampelina]